MRNCCFRRNGQRDRSLAQQCLCHHMYMSKDSSCSLPGQFRLDIFPDGILLDWRSLQDICSQLGRYCLMMRRQLFQEDKRSRAYTAPELRYFLRGNKILAYREGTPKYLCSSKRLSMCLEGSSWGKLFRAGRRNQRDTAHDPELLHSDGLRRPQQQSNNILDRTRPTQLPADPSCNSIQVRI